MNACRRLLVGVLCLVCLGAAGAAVAPVAVSAAEIVSTPTQLLTPEQAGEFGPASRVSQPSASDRAPSAHVEGPSSSASTPMSLASEPLSVSGGEWLSGGEQQPLSEAARRDAPEAIAKREESQTKYEELGGEQAAQLAAEVFPRIVDHAAGGPPSEHVPVGVEFW